MEKRTKEVKFRCTLTEFNQLLEKKTKPRLAEWIRDIALNEPTPIIKKIDPNLMIALSRIGGNINQIAKTCNSRMKLDKYESVNILLELDNIKNQLDEIIKSL